MKSAKVSAAKSPVIIIGTLLFFSLTFFLQTTKAQESQEGPAVRDGGGTSLYLPIVARDLPRITLQPIAGANAANQWTLNWSVDNPDDVTGYRIEESKYADFNTLSNVYNTTDMTLTVTGTPSWQSVHYYRISATGAWGNGPYSNVASVAGSYRDDFNDPSSGWAMRRQDTDDIDNQVYYRNGLLVLEMDSSWDYQLASPMVPAPSGNYSLIMRTHPKGVDNLHAYGMVFGGDWNGGNCPAADYSTCFNHYYRLLVVWNGSANQMLMQLKRIETHSPVNNSGSGTALVDWRFVTVNSSSADFQTWQVDVNRNGTINLYVNGNHIATVSDTAYINDPYWGVFSATDEYNGLEAETDWFEVIPR